MQCTIAKSGLARIRSAHSQAVGGSCIRCAHLWQYDAAKDDHRTIRFVGSRHTSKRKAALDLRQYMGQYGPNVIGMPARSAHYTFGIRAEPAQTDATVDFLVKAAPLPRKMTWLHIGRDDRVQL